MAIATVCVIEDDEGIRDIVRDLLTDEGYAVIEAATGLDGKRLLDASAERLIVILDYRLPALDGCDLLEIVAQDEDLRERHTFIMMSASPAKTVEDCEEAIDELNVPIVPKPFDIDELVEAVRQAQMRLDPGGEPAPAGS
ncbi:MAG TPA: response regulator [Ktedonobacterales bacterium]|jgi:two-component system nitrogen regulation response regulator NtrX